MRDTLVFGAFLAIASGLMNGSFTLPMRFLGRWDWEHMWSLFIVGSCLIMPTTILALQAPGSWAILAGAPAGPVMIAVGTGFAWGFGSLMFGQSVSAIGISLANTLVLAISSALGSFVPLLFSHQSLLEPAGRKVLCGVGIEIIGIVLCGRAGRMREMVAGIASQRGDLVGKPRTLGVALMLAIGAGILSAVFNIGFTLAQPVIAYGKAEGLSAFDSTNLVWWVMLGSGSIANLTFCGYLFAKNRNFAKFGLPRSKRLYGLTALMALLWGGSIFVYGAAAPRLGSLGTAIGWPLSLATGLVLANAIGMGLGEWTAAPASARRQMYAGIVVLAIAIVLLSRAGS